MSNKESNKSRRDFIKKGAAGIAGVAVVPSFLKGESKSSPAESKKKRKLIYRTLGKTGMKLPIVNMGVMNSDNPNLIRAALDAGITLLDTAWYYMMGRNEETIGKVIKERPRNSYYIATKVWEPRDYKTGLFPKDASPDTFKIKFHTSLKRLGLDYVDILYLHNITRKESALFEPYVNAMQQLKKEGKIRFIGVTTHRNEPEVIRAAADSKIYEVVLTSYNFRQKHVKEVEAAIDYAAKAGLGIVAMKTQAGVYWDGREKKQPINMIAALKWALQNKNIHTAIPGFTTFDQLETDLSVMEDLTLTPKEKADLKLDQKVSMSGFYCQQCEKCLPQCSKKVEIPTLMRSYMYAYAYKNLEKAKQTLKTLNLSKLPCSSCETCNVKCSMGFNIRERAIDISRLNDVPEDLFV